MPAHNIALVLSSGGARGVAHIAVIEELLRDGHRITSVAGSSMGAVVSGIYAGGHLTQYKEWLQELDYWDVFNLLDFSISSQGFVKGEKVFKKIDHFIPKVNIEELPIPFVAVAADVVHKKQVVFDHGNLKAAIRASVSIPTILHPIKTNDSLLVDGGVVNPVPVDLVRRHPGDKLVVVDVNANIPYQKPHLPAKERSLINELKQRYFKWRKKEKKKQDELGIFDLMTRSFEFTQETLSNLMLEHYKPDLIVRISREAANTMDFHKTLEILALGREAYREAIRQNDDFS
ncbi:MAG TPA: phospholipase [Flammeovirgaceae bacterium]|nr:phospholipase [Flammeovirgaceae bacterium]